MKSFLLHEDDGESAARVKTDELHAFLSTIVNDDTPHDFEGTNSGLSIWFQVEVGDTMIVRDDGSFRVLPKNQPVAITKHSFPMTHAAMLLVEYDNGAHHANRLFGEGTVNLDQFNMPYAYGVDKLVKCEAALHLLMVHAKTHGFEEFATGEQSDQEALIQSLEPLIPDLRTAHGLLNDWFNSWETA